MEWTVTAEHGGLRLDRFLAEPVRLGSRRRAVDALGRGKVFVNGTEAAAGASATRLAVGDVVRVWIDRPGSARRRAPEQSSGLSILYEDDALLVIDKPAGLLAVPLPPERRFGATSVFDQLVSHLRPRGKRRPLVVHRIDRDTSGLVVFAKTPAAQIRLKDQFKRRTAERVYRAIVYGHPNPSSGTWHDHLVWDRKALIQKETHPRDPQGKEAVSEYSVIERFRAASLIEVRLVSGKRNQIRIQARLRGHTLVGERRYTFGPEFLRSIAFERQALHAFRLGFEHPTTRRPLQFEAPLPGDLVALIARLRADTPGVPVR